MTNQKINDAAQLVVDAEKEALGLLSTALDNLETALVEIESKLPNRITMDAGRMVWEIRNNMLYRRQTELPAAIAKYQTVTAAPEGDTPTS